MSWREFVHWQAYLQIEPPDKAAAERTAVLLAQITNMSGRILPGKKTVKPDDFLSGLGFDVAPPRPQTMEEQLAFMKSLPSSKDG
jgi:hypothetical protein